MAARHRAIEASRLVRIIRGKCQQFLFEMIATDVDLTLA